jgi:hypothetical protein
MFSCPWSPQAKSSLAVAACTRVIAPPFVRISRIRSGPSESFRRRMFASSRLYRDLEGKWSVPFSEILIAQNFGAGSGGAVGQGPEIEVRVAENSVAPPKTKRRPLGPAAKPANLEWGSETEKNAGKERPHFLPPPSRQVSLSSSSNSSESVNEGRRKGMRRGDTYGGMPGRACG